jgi:hypothetical protein
MTDRHERHEGKALDFADKAGVFHVKHDTGREEYFETRKSRILHPCLLFTDRGLSRQTA